MSNGIPTIRLLREDTDRRALREAYRKASRATRAGLASELQELDHLAGEGLDPGIAGNRVGCEVMVEQARAIDNRRLRKALGRVPPLVRSEVREKLRRLFDL